MKRRRRLQKAMEMGSDGRTWTRGATIGKGSFGTVSLAKTTGPNKRRSYLPPSIAVKWTEVSDSYSLQKEKEILSNFSGCPYILHCFGEEVTVENGQMIYNVLLEYGAGGSLADRIRNSAGGLPESEVKRYTRSILRGLSYIHAQSYVHCDIKPQNILLVPPSSLIKKRRKGEDYVAKIADFGVAKKVQQKWKNETPCWRGTPLYMSPESIAHNSQEPPSDIWALGCVVSEMISGKPAWSCKPGETRDDLLQRIGWSHELPRIPGDLSNEGKDFLKRCFVRTTMFRWTAEMLLHHPFVASDGEDIGELEGILSLSAPAAAGLVWSLLSLSETGNRIQKQEIGTRIKLSCSSSDLTTVGGEDLHISSGSEEVDEMNAPTSGSSIECTKLIKVTSSTSSIEDGTLEQLSQASLDIRQKHWHEISN